MGPLAHGTVQYGLLDATRRLVFSALDFIEKHNQRLLALARDGGSEAIVQNIDGKELVFSPLVALPQPQPPLPYYERVFTVDFPRDPVTGALAGVIDPTLEGKDWSSINSNGDGLFVDLDGKPLPHPLPSLPVPAGPPVSTPIELHAIFINEASYLEKGTAMVISKKVEKYVY